MSPVSHQRRAPAATRVPAGAAAVCLQPSGTIDGQSDATPHDDHCGVHSSSTSTAHACHCAHTCLFDRRCVNSSTDGSSKRHKSGEDTNGQRRLGQRGRAEASEQCSDRIAHLLHSLHTFTRAALSLFGAPLFACRVVPLFVVAPPLVVVSPRLVLVGRSRSRRLLLAPTRSTLRRSTNQGRHGKGIKTVHPQRRCGEVRRETPQCTPTAALRRGRTDGHCFEFLCAVSFQHVTCAFACVSTPSVALPRSPSRSFCATCSSPTTCPTSPSNPSCSRFICRRSGRCKSAHAGVGNDQRAAAIIELAGWRVRQCESVAICALAHFSSCLVLPFPSPAAAWFATAPPLSSLA